MYCIGIDLGGTNIAAGIVDESYNILVKDSVPTRPERAPDEITADMGALCNSLVSRTGLTISDIACAGIASPGIANSATGVIEYSCNLPYVNYNLADALKKHFPVSRVCVENDANAAAKGEAVSGAAKGADTLGERYAEEKGYTCKQFPADWGAHGRAAGFRRNEQMLEQADGVIAFSVNESKGTEHMIKIAKEAGKKVAVKRLAKKEGA